MHNAGLEVAVDRIGNIFGIWNGSANARDVPVLMGSHLDTVIDGGIYDGCYGVLSGLEVIETLKSAGFVPARAVAVATFTNEEGVRYAPDMMGSLVYAGGLSVEEALGNSQHGRKYSRTGAAADRLWRVREAGLPQTACLHRAAHRAGARAGT